MVLLREHRQPEGEKEGAGSDGERIEAQPAQDKGRTEVIEQIAEQIPGLKSGFPAEPNCANGGIKRRRAEQIVTESECHRIGIVEERVPQTRDTSCEPLIDVLQHKVIETGVDQVTGYQQQVRAHGTN